MKDKDLQSKIKQLTLKLVSLKALILAQYSVGDKDLLQFTAFLSKEKVTNNDKFSTFSRKTQWLDDLYFDDIRFYEKYPKLSAVMQIVLFIFKLNQNDDNCGWEIYQRLFKSTPGSTTDTCYRSENGLFIQEFLEDVQYSLGKHQRE